TGPQMGAHLKQRRRAAARSRNRFADLMEPAGRAAAIVESEIVAPRQDEPGRQAAERQALAVASDTRDLGLVDEITVWMGSRIWAAQIVRVEGAYHPVERVQPGLIVQRI